MPADLMSADPGGRLATPPREVDAGFAVLDRGPIAVDAWALAAAMRLVLVGEAPEVARDRNAICRRVQLPLRHGGEMVSIVKEPRPGPQRTNRDTSFAGEAQVLAQLPGLGITLAPRLIARVAAGGSHYLFTEALPGAHPDSHHHRLDPGQLEAIAEGLFVLDRCDLMHYDLKPANLLVAPGAARFLDFEFARFHDHRASFASATASFCADFNVGANPLVPTRSNVANFEFRTLDRHLQAIAAADRRAADTLLRDWLKVRAGYHRRTAALFTKRAAAAESVAIGSDCTVAKARACLLAGADYELLLAGLLECGSGTVLAVERALMAFRCAVFERRDDDARRVRRAALDALDDDCAGARALPAAYRKASLRVFDLVARGVHPDGRRDPQAVSGTDLPAGDTFVRGLGWPRR